MKKNKKQQQRHEKKNKNSRTAAYAVCMRKRWRVNYAADDFALYSIANDMENDNGIDHTCMCPICAIPYTTGSRMNV